MRKIIRGIRRAAAKMKQGVKSWQGLGDAIHSTIGDGLISATAEFVAKNVCGRDSCGCIRRQSRLNSRVPFRPPVLVIGIPHRNDLEGVWSTLLGIRRELLGKSIRWFGCKVPLTEIVKVVINNQKSNHSVNGQQVIVGEEVAKKLDGYANSMRRSGLQVHVEHQPLPHGSARAKQGCCNWASNNGGEWILICDAHVEFKPGALQWLCRWLSKHKNRSSRDLYYGFLLNDHMAPAADPNRLQGANGYCTLAGWDRKTNLPRVGLDNLWGQWADPVIYAHTLETMMTPEERKLLAKPEWVSHGFFFPLCSPKFAARFEAIVGNFKIGDEFWTGSDAIEYLRLMLDAKGKDGQPLWGTEKRLQVFEGLCDGMTDIWPESFEIEGSGGWMLLSRVDQTVPGLDAINQQVKHPWLYFPEMKGFGGEETILAYARRDNGYAVKCLTPLAAYHRFMRTQSGHTYGGTWEDSLRNHLIAAHKLAGALGGRCLRVPGVVSPMGLFAKAYVASGRPQERVDAVLAEVLAAIHGQPEPPKTITVPAEVAQAAATMPPASVFESFTQLKSKPSDINEHLQTLFDLAFQFDHVTEFGTRHGVSTTALLAAQPKTLVSYDTQKTCSCKGLEQLRGKTDLQLKQGPEFDTASMPPIEKTDMLLVDSKHTAEHVYAELSRHSPSVAHVIALHDTEAPWGSQDEGGGSGGGVRAGISRWLASPSGSDWFLEAEFKNNHGLHVYRRRQP